MTSLQTAINVESQLIPIPIVKTTVATCFSFNVMNVLQNMKAVAVRNARIPFIFRPKEGKNSGRGLIKGNIFLTNQGNGCFPEAIVDLIRALSI